MTSAGSPDNTSNLNNLRDILQTYNKLTELCFSKCVTNMNYREVTEQEASCVNRCSGKYISGNQRIMGTFMEIQSRKQQQMFEEQAKLEAEQLSASSKASVDMMQGQSEQGIVAPEKDTDKEQASSGVS